MRETRAELIAHLIYGRRFDDLDEFRKDYISCLAERDIDEKLAEVYDGQNKKTTRTKRENK